MCLILPLWLAGCAIPRAYVAREVQGFGSDAAVPPTVPTVAARPRNVVLMIGDGLGLSQITAARIARGGPLHLEGFGVVGLQQTWAADALVTDSAASATAMACGVKTNNGVIGMTPDGVAVPSVLHRAEAAGLATGVVATSRVTHATPAAFVAHHMDRANEQAIALDFLDVELDVLIGGGADMFEHRVDGRDLIAEMEAQGVDVVRSLVGIAAEGRVAAFLDERSLAPARTGRRLPLAASTGVALDRLAVEGLGFFLLVEGSQIDWGAHLHHTPYMVTETLDFDDAVGRALSFAKSRGDTLVVVTADHETGGLAIQRGDLATREVVGRYTTHHHTATMVPVFAYGPGADLFAGTYDNTGIHDRLAALLPPPDPR